MSGEAVRVLLVGELPEIAWPANWSTARCVGLDQALDQLDGAPVDAVVLGLRTGALAALPSWAGLARVTADAAVVVNVEDQPALEMARRLVRLGVQDVLAGDGPGLLRATALALERRALQESARKARSTDAMTGLPDATQLAEQMSQLLALREREPAPMALLAVRLDGLADAEALVGREGANALRRKVAVRLRVGLRAGDVVASVGPDLLAVLLARMQDAQDGERVAAKLRLALQTPFTVSGGVLSVRAAIGIARYPQDGRDAATLMRVATGQATGEAGHGAAAANDPG